MAPLTVTTFILQWIRKGDSLPKAEARLARLLKSGNLQSTRSLPPGHFRLERMAGGRIEVVTKQDERIDGTQVPLVWGLVSPEDRERAEAVKQAIIAAMAPKETSSTEPTAPESSSQQAKRAYDLERARAQAQAAIAAMYPEETPPAKPAATEPAPQQESKRAYDLERAKEALLGVRDTWGEPMWSLKPAALAVLCNEWCEGQVPKKPADLKRDTVRRALKALQGGRTE